MSKKILVIDDDTDICLLLKRFLSKNEFEVEVAYNGRKGLELLEIFKPDLVMTDFKLGDIDGGQLLVKIKEKHPEMPVLIITGYSDIKVAVNVIKQGAFDYITKPLFPDEILITIKKALANDNSQPASYSKPANNPTGETPKTKNINNQEGCLFGDSNESKTFN